MTHAVTGAEEGVLAPLVRSANWSGTTRRAGRQLDGQRAHCGQCDHLANSHGTQRPQIRPVRHDVRREAMIRAVPGQERNLPIAQACRRSERRSALRRGSRLLLPSVIEQ